MKFIKSEANALQLHGYGKSSHFYNAILHLPVDGDWLVIEKAEWGTRKYLPTRLVRKIEKKYGMKFTYGALPDRTGWTVKRVK